MDSGFNLDAGQAYFDRLYLPFIEAYCRPETIVVHSTSSLLSLIQRQGCECSFASSLQLSSDTDSALFNRTTGRNWKASRSTPSICYMQALTCSSPFPQLELEQIEVSHGVDERMAIHDYDEPRPAPGTRCRLIFHDKVLAERTAVGEWAVVCLLRINR